METRSDLSGFLIMTAITYKPQKTLTKKASE
jgi:hypothetical protein